ncbi:hypothetical protein BDR05DRAFT_952347 [Suillus weaverae]|nr:hypothetical protein BDR05DRAFT_952347 [Suillus weaverae]
MSCKGKDKANATAGGKIIRTCKKSNANAFKVDKRPVQGTIDMDGPAARTVALDDKLEKAIIGIGKINVLEIENDVQFGRYNDRPLKISEVNKMITSFDKHGMQWTKSENAIAIVIEPARLAAGQMLEGRWNSPDTLTSIKLSDKEPIQLASGQHRVAALRKAMDKYLKEEESLNKHLLRLQDKEALTEEEVVEHEELRKRLAKVKGHIDEMGQWGVILYDIVYKLVAQFLNWSREVGAPMLGHEIIDGEKDLGKHLSQNQVLHIYSETQEEQLVSILRDMKDAYDEGGQQAATKTLDDQHKKTTVNKNSKLTRVLKQTHLMTILMRDVLTMGPHFRLRREFNVGWLSKSIQTVMGMYARYMAQGVYIWRYLGAKVEDGPTTLAEAKNIVEDFTQADEEGYTDALQRLLAIMGKIPKVQEEDCLVFLPMMKEIDDVAVKCFKSYEGSLGARQPDYEEAVKRYREDVIRVLKQYFSSQGHRSPEEKHWHEDVLGRTYIWLTDTHGENMPMPLMTGYIMDRVWDELDAAKDGFSEASACVVEVERTTHRHSHAVDDSSEAIFSAIERERGMDGTEAAESAFRSLWIWRSSGVLHLHNKMSEPDVQQMMGKCPKTKDEFVTAWDAMPETTQKQAKTMYDQHKKFFGFGEIDLPISSMGMPCMHGLMVTGWDWQRVTVKKNLPHEAEPLVQAMFLEQHIAESIQKSMTDMIPQSKLKASKAGSLAKRKEWAYWDGITVDEPGEDLKVKDQIDAEAQARLVEANRRIAAEKADHDAILKIRKTIMSMPIARVTCQKKSGLTLEVADAINQLTKVNVCASRLDAGCKGEYLRIQIQVWMRRFKSGCEGEYLRIQIQVWMRSYSPVHPDLTLDAKALMMSASRQRKRFLSGVKTKEFNITHDIVDLNIPDVEGLPDRYTIRSAVTGAEAEREGTDADADGADGDDEGEEETLPRATTKSPKGKGKAKEHAPAAVFAEASRDTDVEMEDASEKQVKPKSPRTRPVPAKKTMKATPLATKVASELFPRGQATDGQDTTDGRVTDEGQDDQDDGRDDGHATDAQGANPSLTPIVEDSRSVDASLDLRTGLMDMNLDRESALSSPSPTVQSDIAVEVMPPQLVQDHELAAELDASDLRSKHPSAPRTAPVSSKGVSHQSIAGSARSSAMPSGGGSTSKRSRRDTLLKSPDNKKKSKHHTGLSVSTHAKEDDTHLVTPDM